MRFKPLFYPDQLKKGLVIKLSGIKLKSSGHVPDFINIIKTGMRIEQINICSINLQTIDGSVTKNGFNYYTILLEELLTGTCEIEDDSPILLKGKSRFELIED